MHDVKSLYLETDASGISLRTWLLYVRDGMKFGYDKVPNHVILHPITFASKGMSSAEWQYSNIEWKALGVLQD